MHVDRFHSGTGTNADDELPLLFSSAFSMSVMRTVEVKESYTGNGFLENMNSYDKCGHPTNGSPYTTELSKGLHITVTTSVYIEA
jgi:hypothetical protein